MTKLHLITQPIELLLLKRNITRYVSENDEFLFIGDSVTSLLDSDVIAYLGQVHYTVNILKADGKSRGLTQLIDQSIHQISDDKMVELTIKHQQTVSW